MPQSSAAPRRVYTQSYRDPEAQAIWCALEPPLVKLLLMLGLAINEAGMGQTTYVALAAQLGWHRTTVAKYIQALANWHGPNREHDVLALVIVPRVAQTRHGRRWAGITYKLAEWIPMSFGRVKLSAIPTQACVGPSTDNDLKEKRTDQEKILPLPPPHPKAGFPLPRRRRDFIVLKTLCRRPQTGRKP